MGDSVDQLDSTKNLASPDIQPGLVEALTATYAALLKKQRTASAAYVRWTPSTSRAHEFVWLESGREQLLTGNGRILVRTDSLISRSVQKMNATMELNPYERELHYGYPYVIGQLNGTVYRAPLFTIPVGVAAEGADLILSAKEDVIRFNSLPFRSDSDSEAREFALSRLIAETPELPLTIEPLRDFCSALARELELLVTAKLDGGLNAAPSQPKTEMQLTIVDNAACFVAPKTSYFLVSDLELIGSGGTSEIGSSSLGWLVGKRPQEPTIDKFEDRRKLFYPFPSNSSQRRVAHLVDDPKSRITVVQGPPGTGKSLTIANLACHLIAHGKRVLVTSQKDKALQVVDELLRGLEMAQLPMTLLRQDRDSKNQLRERLESIQKERSTEETKQFVDARMESHLKTVQAHTENLAMLRRALKAEHFAEKADLDFRNASGTVSRIAARWRRYRTLRRAEREASIRSDAAARALSLARERLLAIAVSVLEGAAQHRVSAATKAERNQLREFAELLARNQSNFKNYPIFDRLKADPARCEMLLKILPCWIMTPDDVARLFPCKPGLFDVVIIDEASQCDLPSMTPVLFRAKQAVIAGDSKQMQSQRFAFTSNQVSSQARAEHRLDSFDPDGWLDPAKVDLLQLASIRMDEEAFLDEHYRSLPPIIGFSNGRWYGGRLRIMRDADDKRFGAPEGPTITLRRTAGTVTRGTQENETEARELVEHLCEMMHHPAYVDASFGVICLFEEQMRLVNDLVMERIPEDVRSDHELVVVNPDGFQGDERDVVLYSLSFDAAGMSVQALSARQAEREHIQGMLNVAFTRARDEIVIFHSADIAEFGMVSGSGVIKEWLEYCAAQSLPEPVGNPEIQLSKAQSQFEYQVMSALLSRGIAVTSQYPSCGFFIDIVAELGSNRVAVECDGEIWHLDEHGELKTEDVERQEILERAGWTVLRIPYRSWIENPQHQIARVVEGLGNGEHSADNEPQNASPSEAATSESIDLDRFENAIVRAVKAGLTTCDEVFRSARDTLGYARLGPQIRVSLNVALERLAQRGVVRVEEDEVFFSDERARNANYVVKSIATPNRRPRRGYYRRYRRW